MPTNKTFVRLDLYITPETKERLRVKAFQERRAITEIVREILEKTLEEETKDTKSPAT